MSQSDNFNVHGNSQKVKSLKNLVDPDQSTSFEVFRNNTTAVEVLIKEVPNKKKIRTLYQDKTVKSGHPQEVGKLQNNLHKPNSILEDSRHSFQLCLREMQKQIDYSNQRELELQSKYLTVKIENEKMRAMLMSKTNLVKKLSKELNILKRIIKTVVKSMINAPKVNGLDLSFTSDPECEECDNNMTTDKIYTEFGQSSNFDSTVLKEVTAKYKQMFE